jgi:hypothetical protein
MDGEITETKPSRPVSPVNGQPVPNGRPRGVPNKATTRFKEALNELFETAAPDMVKWLAEIDNPKERFDVLSKFANYIYPQLARTEKQMLDADGQPTNPGFEIVVTHVRAEKNKN